MGDDRQYAPATLRNRDFILDVLRGVLPTTGVILEVASGSGEHIVRPSWSSGQPLTASQTPDRAWRPLARLEMAAAMNWRVVSAPTRSHPPEQHAEIVCGHFGDSRSRETNGLRYRGNRFEVSQTPGRV